MPFFLDTQETSQRFGSHIAEFCSLLDTNYLSHGSPADFFSFAESLEKNNSFRLDLSALVKSVAQQEHGELLLTDMMSIIAASVCGPSYADTGIDVSGPSNTLMEFLLGTGLWKQFGSPPPRKTQDAVPSATPPPRAEQPLQSSKPVAPSPSPENSVERATLLDASSELRQTLTRLEINTLQVKLHLESIERRINKIEPATENPDASNSSVEPSRERVVKEQPPIVAIPPAPVQAAPAEEPTPEIDSPGRSASWATQHEAHPPASEPASEDVLLPIDPPLFGSLSSSSRNRAVFSEPAPDPDDDGFTAPTFGYATERGRSAIPISIAVILALIVAAFFFFTRTQPGQRLLQSGKEHLAAIRASSTHTTATAIQQQPSSPQSTAQAAAPSVTPETSAPPAQTTTAATGSSTASPSPQSSSADTSDAAAAHARTPNLPYIPANVMEGNLLAAPRPVYPASARDAHLEGVVGLEATISRSGSIMTLHFIKGPSALRTAAINAVRHWRYKPYQIDGHAVPVVTTIYVNFNLRPPPTIVH